MQQQPLELELLEEPLRHLRPTVARIAREGPSRLGEERPDEVSPTLARRDVDQAQSFIAAHPTIGELGVDLKKPAVHAGAHLAPDGTERLDRTRASVRATPKSKLSMKRVSTNAEARPIRAPAAISSMPLATVQPRTSEAFAPRAIRTPISWVRWRTV